MLNQSPTIPYGRQSISESDIQEVVDVLKSDWLTQGPMVERFEAAVAKYCGARFAVAVNSATSALHIACLVAGLGPGDLLWTSPNSFVASANCALYCGAIVDFVDIDPYTYNLSVSALGEKLSHAKKTGRLPKVVIPVHFSGQPCAMESLAELAQEYGFKLIEDASHAIGGKYRGEPVGNCRYSDLTVFSFHPVKIMTTGEGGMVLTNDEPTYQALTRLRSHGITRAPELMQGENHGPWYYQQVDLGFNYRMTDLQAGLGLSQLGRLDQFVVRRHQLVARYNEAFRDLPLELPWQDQAGYSSFHLYVIVLQLDCMIRSRREVFEELRNRGILVNVHYIPIHTQPYYRQLGFSQGQFPVSERYYRGAITLPLYYDLREEQQDRVIAAVCEAVR